MAGCILRGGHSSQVITNFRSVEYEQGYQSNVYYISDVKSLQTSQASFCLSADLQRSVFRFYYTKVRPMWCNTCYSCCFLCRVYFLVYIRSRVFQIYYSSDRVIKAFQFRDVFSRRRISSEAAVPDVGPDIVEVSSPKRIWNYQDI